MFFPASSVQTTVPMNDPFDPASFSKLVKEQHGSLLLYAKQWLAVDAEDIVQEAFLRLLRLCLQRGSTGQTIDNPAAWLFRVVRNEAIGRLRRQSVLGKHWDRFRNEQKPWFESDSAQTLETKETQDAIAETIAAMPLELREVLVPKLWGGLSFQEIGEITETSESTAHRRYVEALQYLKKQLGSDVQ